MAEKAEYFKTPEFRASFPHLLKPDAYKEGDTPKYRVSMLFDKKSQASDEYKKIRTAAKQAFVDKFGRTEWENTPKDATGWPFGYFNPFKKATEKQIEKYDGYNGDVVIISASTMYKTPFVDEARNAILEEGVFYGGCYGWAQITVNAYSNGTNKGVSFYLNGVQKTRDGEAFSGRARAEDLFEVVSPSEDTGFDDMDLEF